MKQVSTIAAMLTLLALQAHATIWRVNNNTGVAANYTTLSAAVSGAAAGDTIYLEGSATNYGGATIAKKLTIIGTGYFLADTANHETQWNTNAAAISDLTFSPGSKGSKLSGVVEAGSIYLNDSLVTIERSLIYTYILLANAASSYADHDTIRQCVLGNYIISQTSTGSAKGVMIYNNIIAGGFSFGNNLANTTAYVINNTIIGYDFTCQNCVFQNNIFWSTSTYFNGYASSNYFAYNVFTVSSSYSGVSGVATGNSNQFGVSTSALFVVSSPSSPANIYATPPTGYSHDGQYQLATSSPALGAGNINGTTVDCGAFGGPAPYILSGMPNIPSIYSLTVPAQVNNGTTSMNITLSAAAH
ncbi:MAG: hypothetical protein QM642_02870 [Edaphocola sp.]